MVTPERVVLDCEAEFAALPAWDGEIGGFTEMVDNKLSVLTEHARFAKDLDRETVEQALKDAQAMEVPDLLAIDARSKASARAKAQLELL